jgi:hypothetical protein
MSAARHSAVRRPRKKTRFATRKKREGIVILIVMLMLMMATGTAMFTIQSTQYEQRASTSVGEASWARGISECTTMAALAYAEDTAGNGGTPPTLGAQWLPDGTLPAKHARKYGFPQPINPNPGAASTDGDRSGSMAVDISLSPFASNATAPGGLAAFLPGERRRTATVGLPVYPSLQDRDDQGATTQGLRFYRTHWLQETFRINPSTVEAGKKGGTVRYHTIITGFAESRVVNDRDDSSGVRDIHEIDAISRGYIDRIE